MSNLPYPIHILGFEIVRRNFGPSESSSELWTVVVGDSLLVVVYPGPEARHDVTPQTDQYTDPYLRLRVSPAASSGSVSASVALKLFLRMFFRGEALDFLEGDVGEAS